MRLEDTALARAIEGEERMVVSGGKVMGYETRFNDALIMFFLRNRRGERYAPDWRALKPGHPLYERIAAEAVAAHSAAEEQDVEEVRRSIDAFIEGIRVRRQENGTLLAEQDAEARAAEERDQARVRARPAPREEDDEGVDPGR